MISDVIESIFCWGKNLPALVNNPQPMIEKLSLIRKPRWHNSFKSCRDQVLSLFKGAVLIKQLPTLKPIEAAYIVY